MIYIVSGFMRSGTSMMMRALEAGGLEACYKASRDELIEKHSDEHYAPNPALYELERSDYRDPTFPDKYEGKLIKCLAPGMFRLKARQEPKDAYQIVFMRRDPEEIRQSFQAFFGRDNAGVENSHETVERAHDILAMRRDVRLLMFWYRDVVSAPLDAFQRLRLSGWPIDPNKAAAVVDPALCRYRIEELDIGA